ncbi:hypothetical protein ACHAWF_004306, partial [Thalassiosira exigua]
ASAALLLLPALHLASIARGFQAPAYRAPGRRRPTTRFPSLPPDAASRDDGDDDAAIDPDSLGDWRAFRMNLASGGAGSPSSVTSSAPSVDGIDLEDATGPPRAATAAPAAPSRPSSVSSRNEALLGTQNAALAEEYLGGGAWAHCTAVPEAGGLVCRMPLEAEIYRGPEDSRARRKLAELLASDEPGGEGAAPDSPKGAASTGGDAAAAAGAVARSSEDAADERDADSTFSALAANTAIWYRSAERLLKQELAKITSNANSNGRINSDDLDEESLEILQLYVDHQQSWQEVCLVLERDERTGRATTVTINRPMAFKLSESLGRLLLMGAHRSEHGVAVNKKERDGDETQRLVKFLAAFESECGVYVGGPDGMDEPATIVHGVADLPGAEEVSPGTGIYRGGLDAAVDGVLAGRHRPLDFRFFVGRATYEGGSLDDAVARGKYQPVACSRPLVLKQCLRLPKPLWHEVLEFCGGELKEISRLELAKRADLR